MIGDLKTDLASAVAEDIDSSIDIEEIETINLKIG